MKTRSRAGARIEPGAVVLVTGASSGIGHATALAAAARGATVVAVARREDRLAELAERCRSHAPESGYLAGDLGDRAFAERAVSETRARFGRLDVLVNNAAITKHRHVLRLEPDECERVMRVNFLSCVWTSLAALPHMVSRGSGAIVNVSSFAAWVVPAREAVYAASKAAMNAFTEGLWHDLAGTGVHAALVIPGPIDTEIWEKLDEPPAYTGRRHPPEDVATSILRAAEGRTFEVVVPRRDPGLVVARWLRHLAPGLLRYGIQRMDPNPPELIAELRGPAARS